MHGMKTTSFYEHGCQDVLVVEDSATQALKLQHLLEQNGCAVSVAYDGRQALERLKDHRPDLIISDIVMPGIDGYEMCRRIKANGDLRSIPIVLLTSLSDPHDVIRGLEASADAFATQPYRDESLLRRVNSILVNRGLGGRPSGGDVPAVFFEGKEHTLSGDPRKITEFLLYTYEDAVEKNLDLIDARDALAQSNRELERYTEQLRCRNREMEDDLRMAREIQQAFLPRQYPVFPSSAPGGESPVSFSHVYLPCATLGGDFFALLTVSDREAGVFVCDVVGHGVRAAMVTAIIRGLVEDLASAASDPGRFLTEVNRGLAAVFTRSNDVVFASAVYSVVDITTGALRYANAGHPCPLHVRRDPVGTAPVRLDRDVRGPALGLLGDTLYDTGCGRLDAGDRVVFFTDGVIEARGMGQEEYGEARLAAALTRAPSVDTQRLLDLLLDEVRTFTGEKGLEDDVCLVGVELASS
jgi:serine phosphatase RsbU (regulator of sigma subunit)/CheY-like chemotaxis protein